MMCALDRQCRTRSRSPSGFTLIELLVVMAILGVLAGLMSPALSGAKAKANSVRCLSNLRQVGIALRLYAEENEGRLPWITVTAAPGSTNAGAATLPRVLDLTTTPELFRCPQDRQGIYERKGSSYEWNPAWNGRLLHRGAPDGMGRGEVRTHLLRDAQPWHPKGTRNAVYADGHAGKEVARR